MGCHDVTTCDKRESRPRLKIIKETLAGWPFVNHEIGMCFCLKESCMSTKEFSFQTYRSHQALFLALFCGHFKLLQCSSCVFFQSGFFHAKWISWRRNRTLLEILLISWGGEFSSLPVIPCEDVSGPPHTPPEKAFRGSFHTSKPKVWLEDFGRLGIGSEVILFTYQVQNPRFLNF